MSPNKILRTLAELNLVSIELIKFIRLNIKNKKKFDNFVNYLKRRISNLE